MATLLVYLVMPSLCMFSKQDNALAGWPDAISAYMMPDTAMLPLCLNRAYIRRLFRKDWDMPAFK